MIIVSVKYDCHRVSLLTPPFVYLHSRSTILVQFKTDKNAELQYKSGDHVAIFPANRPELVQALIDRLSCDIDPDLPIVVEALREIKGKQTYWCLGNSRKYFALVEDDLDNTKP